MNNFKARIAALEKKQNTIGRITLYLSDGTERAGDLLDAVLYHIETQAAPLPRITSYQYRGGSTPTGLVWGQFYKDLHRIRDGDTQTK